MTPAQAVGLNAPNTEYRPIGRKPCILVQRYDRTTDETGHTTRHHQEDFCQAIGFSPERKYQAEGGPTLSDCISLLRDWSTTPVLYIPNIINGLIFIVLIGNARIRCLYSEVSILFLRRSCAYPGADSLAVEGAVCSFMVLYRIWNKWP
jgi:hypothetical protein